jgi:hypothetical protein
MSIENDLNRIANSLESIASHFTAFARQPLTTTQTRTVGEAPAVLSVAPEDQAIAVAPEEPAKPKPATRKKAEAPAPAKAASATKDEVMDALRQLVQIKGHEKGKAILAKHGAARVSELVETAYSAVLADLEAGLRA